jgi:MSHA pilin protein MshD
MGVKHPSRRQRKDRRRRGLTIVEAMIAVAILQVTSLAVTYAVVAGQKHSHEGATAMRAVRLAEDLLEEVLFRPYNDPDGSSALGPEAGESDRSQFDNADDYDGYTEQAGSLTDAAGNAYPDVFQGFARSVAMTQGSTHVSGIDADVPGLTVTVTVSNATGQQWQVTGFVAEEAP